MKDAIESVGVLGFHRLSPDDFKINLVNVHVCAAKVVPYFKRGGVILSPESANAQSCSRGQGSEVVRIGPRYISFLDLEFAALVSKILSTQPAVPGSRESSRIV